MHLKLVVFFAAVALCSARSLVYQGYENYQGSHYYVDIKGHHIVVTAHDGTHVDIYADRTGAGYGDLIHVCVNGPEMDLKTFHVKNHQVVGGVDQIDVLYQIFSQYVGHLDHHNFVQLLDVVAKHVQNDEVHPVVLHALHFLHQWAQGNHSVAHEILAQIEYHHGQSVYGHLGHWGQYGQWGHQYGVGHGIYGVGVQGHHYGWPSHHQGYYQHGGFYGPYSSDSYSSQYGYGYVPHHWWNAHHGQYGHLGGANWGQQHWLNSVVPQVYGQHYAPQVYGHHYAPQHHQYSSLW